jgi:choline dehydrogenase-like flavoprotein
MQTPPYDVIVVGTGASGGWAAKRLSEAGVRVALLEAGRPQDASQFTEHQPAFTLQYRDRAEALQRRLHPIQGRSYAFMEYNSHWYASDVEEPYTTPPGKRFNWVGRLRVVGGRTNVWGRQSYRLSDLDFKAKSHDGYGDDWPIAYRDVAPYYDIVEGYVGISGQAEGVEELPDGNFQPPMPMTCAETQLRARLKDRFGRIVTIGRTANLTRPLNGRAACHYCGPCERGCVTRSYFNAAFTTVADAVATGRCTLITNAMVYQVTTDLETGRATGVTYVDRVTRQLKEVRARTVVLCAQTFESTRILLNSATRQAPNGVGNSSGVLGRYLMDHHGAAGARGILPGLPGQAKSGGPSRPNGIYVIRYRNTRQGPQQQDFIRGYGFQGGGGPEFNWSAPGFGEAYKETLKAPVTEIQLSGFGEVLARHDNYVEIDPDGGVDAFGIPILRIHMALGENERRMQADMAATAAEMLEAAGAVDVRPRMLPGGATAIHEAGLARMGNDPKTSVLNPFCQSHDVPNLFVMDASCFVSVGCQNPTLTIMALAVRSCDYLLEEMKRGEL